MARMMVGALAPLALLPLLAGCSHLPGSSLEITMLVGSALGEFCKESAAAIERDPPRLSDGTRVLLRCRASGSGDVVSEMESHARGVLQGDRRADDPSIPTLVSVDGEIYQELLRHRLQAIAPGRSLIPPSADAPALATSPMVLMTTPPLVKGLQRPQPFPSSDHSRPLHARAPAGPPQPIRFVQTAPTRSNSGLQTLVAMVAEVSGKRPEQLTLNDVKDHAEAVAAIQKHVTRYGSSTDELARTMQRNGVFWASVASVYESSVVAANGRREPGQEALVAVYPRATYSSTMRAILPTAPWVSAQERQAAVLLIERLQQPALQRIAADQGLRPANPAVPMGRITTAYGADPRAVYDSLRAPSPEVVEAIITTWRDQVKKPSRVALVVDSSGSMNGDKLPSAQRSLQAYLAQTGPRDVLGLIDFDSNVREPVVLRGGRADAAKAMTFVSGLSAEGGTRLYDAVEAGRNWLRRTRRPGEILAVVVLTDGVDSGSALSLQALEADLRRSGFASDDRIGVFTIGYGSSGDYDADALRRIAESNGGVFVEGTPDSILKRMEQLQLAF